MKSVSTRVWLSGLKPQLVFGLDLPASADVSDLFEKVSRVSRSKQSDFWLCWCRVRLSPGRSLYKPFGGRSEADVKWNLRVRGGTGDNVTVKDVRPEVRESVIGAER